MALKGYTPCHRVIFPKGGIKALVPRKTGEELLVIPGHLLWTTATAAAHHRLGPVLHTLDPPLSQEEILAILLLFIKAHGYEQEQ